MELCSEFSHANFGPAFISAVEGWRCFQQGPLQENISLLREKYLEDNWGGGGDPKAIHMYKSK
jgi:hypothetical protein